MQSDSESGDTKVLTLKLPEAKKASLKNGNVKGSSKKKPDKRAAKQFDAKAGLLMNTYGKDLEITLPTMTKQDTIDEFIEKISSAVKVEELKALLPSNNIKKAGKNKTEMITALLMHNTSDKKDVGDDDE